MIVQVGWLASLQSGFRFLLGDPYVGLVSPCSHCCPCQGPGALSITVASHVRDPLCWPQGMAPTAWSRGFRYPPALQMTSPHVCTVGPRESTSFHSPCSYKLPPWVRLVLPTSACVGRVCPPLQPILSFPRLDWQAFSEPERSRKAMYNAMTSFCPILPSTQH